jgi:RecA-family ATPase
MTFPPLNYLLPGLIPEGLCLFVSRPKLGKSWLALDLAIATTTSRFVLGDLKPAPGDVLYLALEDGRRRLQRRLTKLLPTFLGTWPSGLTFATEWPRSDQGGLTDIENWITSSKNPRLVIVDTLAQFRKMATGKNVYLEDYAAISELQKLASKYNLTIIVVHHDRKSVADDVFDTVSGSLGLTGAADTIAIMKREGGAVTLHVRGRDVEEAEKALQFCQMVANLLPKEAVLQDERVQISEIKLVIIDTAQRERVIEHDDTRRARVLIEAKPTV